MSKSRDNRTYVFLVQQNLHAGANSWGPWGPTKKSGLCSVAYRSCSKHHMGGSIIGSVFRKHDYLMTIMADGI